MVSNISGLLEIDDFVKNVRIRDIFALDDIIENESDSIFNYLLSFRDDLPLNTLFCLKILGEHIMKFNDVFQYISLNVSVSILYKLKKLEWIFYFLRDIDNDITKKDNLQIEASADGINFLELFNSTQEIVNFYF